MTDTSQIAAYVVRIVTVVDHPELRSPALPAVDAGRRISTERQFDGQQAALGLFKDVCAGEWDFGSEYVARVEVARRYVGGRGAAWVRRPVERQRAA